MENTKDLSIKDQAVLEIRNELVEEAKVKLKSKLRNLRNARLVVANLERELELLELEIKDTHAV